MSVTSFQQALCDLIASPRLCRALRAAPDEVLANYELSARERARLCDVVWQRGMSTNCSLYRANRVTPLYMLLTYTCRSLGDQFRSLLDEFWDAKIYRDGQFSSEVERFAAFLRKRIADGIVSSPFTAELLEFELKLNALRSAPRKQLLREVKTLPAPGPDTPCRIHPLARLVRFHHDPDALLDAAERNVIASAKIPRRESLLALSLVDGEVRVIQLPDDIRRALDDDGQFLESLTPQLAPALADAGLLVERRNRNKPARLFMDA
ncbi:MAG: hypothetical protein ABSB77_25390 [Xanthobacteraceae bacterium]